MNDDSELKRYIEKEKYICIPVFICSFWGRAVHAEKDKLIIESNIHYLHGVIAVFVFNHFNSFKKEKILCGKVDISGSAVLVVIIYF